MLANCQLPAKNINFLQLLNTNGDLKRCQFVAVTLEHSVSFFCTLILSICKVYIPGEMSRCGLFCAKTKRSTSSRETSSAYFLPKKVIICCFGPQIEAISAMLLLERVIVLKSVKKNHRVLMQGIYMSNVITHYNSGNKYIT
jgi:hypothetical protein